MQGHGGRRREDLAIAYVEGIDHGQYLRLLQEAWDNKFSNMEIAIELKEDARAWRKEETSRGDHGRRGRVRSKERDEDLARWSWGRRSLLDL
jgi:hypothetical protein